MKKLVFAAVAALALTSVSNVFAGKTTANSDVTVCNDTIKTAPADTVAPATADTAVVK